MTVNLTTQKLWDVEDLAAHLRKHPSFIYKNWRRWQREGRLPLVQRIGGSIRFPESTVNYLLRSMQIGG